MDASRMTAAQRDWVFSRGYFDVAIYGRGHTVSRPRDWRIEYEMPYVGRESFDDSGEKYGIREPTQRVRIRKYLRKFRPAKCQQMDLYVRPRTDGRSPNVGVRNLPGYPRGYDPRG